MRYEARESFRPNPLDKRNRAAMLAIDLQKAGSMSFSSLEFRAALGQFATGVAVVTCPGDGQGPVGITINSLTSVSLEPPLVLWCLDKASDRERVLTTCTSFVVNVLSKSQEALSARFAAVGQHDFSGIEFTAAETGAPILPGTLAHLECSVTARHEGGDHWIIVGHVDRLQTNGGDPLLYFGGGYRGLQNA